MSERTRDGRRAAGKRCGAPRRASLPGARGAVLSGDGRRNRRLRDVPRARTAVDAEGADRLRQDALRRAHGVASGQAARDGGVPRRPVGRATSPAGISFEGATPSGSTARSRGRRGYGAICYLDEIIEARQDTVVVIHPLTDDRRILPLDKTGEILDAAPGFQLVISYNPGYQHGLKDLKPSTRQRFVALEFDFPRPEVEAEIVRARRRDRARPAVALVTLTNRLRQLGERGLAEVPSTRLIVATARLVAGRHFGASRLPRGPSRPPDRRSRSAGRHARSRELDDAVAERLQSSSPDPWLNPKS